MTEQPANPAPEAPRPAPDDWADEGHESFALESTSGNGYVGSARTVEALEAELANWQRRAVMWRERALSAQTVNEALTKNLEDLRAMLQLRSLLDAARTEHTSTPVRAPVEQWWTKVFRRETWITTRR